MAARGRLGGLAAATRAGLDVLAAAYDWVVVETVGVGQSEVEVADLVDTLVYVAQPGAGDILQYMKAGVLELPDVFAVNKADLGLPAERTAQELRRGLAVGAGVGILGGTFDPPGRVRIPGAAGGGTGVMGSLVVCRRTNHTYTSQPVCP